MMTIAAGVESRNDVIVNISESSRTAVSWFSLVARNSRLNLALIQGALAIDTIGGFVSRTPMLHGALDVQSWRVRFGPTNSSLDILAADAPSAWGPRSNAVFVDEIAQWATTRGPQRLWEAVSTAAAKANQARMVVLTTAGDPAHCSHKALQHAETDPLRRVHQVPGPPQSTQCVRGLPFMH